MFACWQTRRLSSKSVNERNGDVTTASGDCYCGVSFWNPLRSPTPLDVHNAFLCNIGQSRRPLPLLRLSCQLGLPVFRPLHYLWVAGPLYVLFVRRAIQFRVEIVAPLALGLLHLHWNAMGVGPGILANAGHLPGHFHPGFAAGYLELVVRHFLGNVHRSEAANGRKLVAVVPVERPEPFG